MLRTNQPFPPIKARLLVDMVFNGESHSAGDVVEMTRREYQYLENVGRVELAPEKKK